MGFSLRRALAGAVAGGAGAAVELADNAIKAAEVDRQKAQDFERQKELLAIQDENIIRREQRVYDMKERRDTHKAEKFGAFLSQTTQALKAEKIDPASAEGQARISQALLENGYPAEGNKYQENYINLTKIKSDAELKRAEQGIRLEMARERRAAHGSDNSKEDREAERGFAHAAQAGARIKVPTRDGKTVVFENGPAYMQSLYQEALDNGMAPREARNLINDTQVEITKGLKINPSDPDGVAENAIGIARRAWKPADAKPAQSAAPAAEPAPPAGEKKRIPGAPEQLLGGQSSGPAPAPVVFGGFDANGNRKEPGVSVAGVETPSTFQIGTARTHDKYGNRIKF